MSARAKKKALATREGAARPPNAAARQIDLAQRRARVLELRVAGHSFMAIAHEVGLSDGSAARKAYIDAISNITREPAHQAIALELERCDHLQKVAMQAANKGDLEGVRAALKVMERRSALVGLDAPKRAVVQATMGLDDLNPDQLERRRLAIVDLLKASKTDTIDVPALPSASDADNGDGAELAQEERDE